MNFLEVMGVILCLLLGGTLLFMFFVWCGEKWKMITNYGEAKQWEKHAHELQVQLAERDAELAVLKNSSDYRRPDAPGPN